jgi:hypothetical protein
MNATIARGALLSLGRDFVLRSTLRSRVNGAPEAVPAVCPKLDIFPLLACTFCHDRLSRNPP